MSPWWRLLRVSNLPTVWSGAWAGLWLGGGHAAPLAWAGVIGGLSMLYLAGMALNDFFDEAIDRQRGRARPVAAGEISARAALLVGAGLLVAGVLLIAGASGAMRAVLLALALCAAIIAYDALNKRMPALVVLMGVCRSLVYLVCRRRGGSAMTSAPLWWQSAMVGAFVVVVTMVARREHLPGATAPRAARVGLPMALPLLLLAPGTNWSILALTCAAAIVLLILLALRRGGPRAIMGCLAVLPLADALMLAQLPEAGWGAAAAAIGCFALTSLWHRRVAGS